MTFSESRIGDSGLGIRRSDSSFQNVPSTRRHLKGGGSSSLLRTPTRNPEAVYNSRRLVISVPQRLAGLEHVRDPLLGLGLLCELDEMLAFQPEQPRFVHQRAAVDLAAAQHRGDAGGDLIVVLADEASFERS